MIDATKEYITQTGLNVRIYAIDGHYDFPVHGAYRKEGYWHAATWRADGSYSRSGYRELDLCEKPQGAWVNVYADAYGLKIRGGVFPNREAADRAALANPIAPDLPRVACIKVVYTKGEGL